MKMYIQQFQYTIIFNSKKYINLMVKSENIKMEF